MCLKDVYVQSGDRDVFWEIIVEKRETYLRFVKWQDGEVGLTSLLTKDERRKKRSEENQERGIRGLRSK